MTEKSKSTDELTDVQKALLASALGVKTWQELMNEIASVFDDYVGSPWQDFIPNEMLRIWPQLSLETRIVTYIFTRYLAEGANVE